STDREHQPDRAEDHKYLAHRFPLRQKRRSKPSPRRPHSRRHPSTRPPAARSYARTHARDATGGWRTLVPDAEAGIAGAGPNGLVAANVLADAGWRVVVLEAHSTPGGAVRSSELVAPGFVSDWGSSFYPLGKASPVLQS